jgi:hypothetical protein
MAELNKLGHALALNAAISALKTNTMSIEFDGTTWQDIDGTLDGVALGIFFKDELRYLKLRNAIIWNSVRPNLFHIVEVKA